MKLLKTSLALAAVLFAGLGHVACEPAPKRTPVTLPNEGGNNTQVPPGNQQTIPNTDTNTQTPPGSTNLPQGRPCDATQELCDVTPSPELIKVCEESGGGKACLSSRWKKSFYEGLVALLERRKQAGTNPKEPATNVGGGGGDERPCDVSVEICNINPSPELIALCEENGGGQACRSTRWRRSFYEGLVKLLQQRQTQQAGKTTQTQTSTGK